MNVTNEQLLEKLLCLEGYLRRQQNMQFRHHGPFANPHRGQGRVLAILKLQTSITQKELGYLLDMRNQSLSELLIKLEAKEFITRTPSKEDKRTAMIQLTPKGMEAANEKAEEIEPEKFFDVLEAQEKEIFANSLEKLIDALKKEHGAKSPREEFTHEMFHDRFKGREQFAMFSHEKRHSEFKDNKEFE